MPTLGQMRRRPILLILAFALLAIAPSAHAAPVLGIADQKAEMFADQRFADLGIRDARVNLPWDVMSDPATLETADQWMAGAKSLGVRPLVTIDRSRRAGRAGVNPTPAQLRAAVRAWRARWPGQVRQLSAWNEGNINKKPELVAKWWLAVRKACLGCTVLGADIVDRGNAISWAKRFVKAAGRAPSAWGIHNYLDVNRFSTSGTAAFLRALPGDVWLTETGGVVARTNTAVAFRGKGPTHAARATDFLLRKVVALSPRIKRVYLYHWGIGETATSWDSALIGPHGNARPALGVVRNWLQAPTSAKAGALAYKAPARAKGKRGMTKAGKTKPGHANRGTAMRRTKTKSRGSSRR